MIERSFLDKARPLDLRFGEWVVQHFSAHLKKAADKKRLQQLATAVSYATFLKHSCLDLGDDAVPEGLITDAVKPLVLSADRRKLWLQKYYAFEKGVAQALLTLQREQRLEIITGGPGTGKTWTAAERIRLAKAQDTDSVIALAAPTGKAANNMMAALEKAKLNAAELHLKGQTLHTLLGMNSRRPEPRHHRDNPLAADLVIVDEASMIDLPMMYRLLQALPTHARLILLGDKDQLASVEAGSVLHDICSAPVFANCITTLRESRRYKDSPEIGVLAQALNEGRVPDMSAHQHVRRHPLPEQNPWQPPWLSEALPHLDGTPEQLQRFQILCALREGPQGVAGINAIIEQALGHSAESWYVGKPLLVTVNDHDRKLYNGDVGIVQRVEGELKACFRSDGSVRYLSRAQMPPHETCYAMTVHKSQGSEYDHVLIVLPDTTQNLSPVLTRELVYTAVTRAKTRVDIWCGDKVLENAAQKTLRRMSGLKELL